MSSFWYLVKTSIKLGWPVGMIANLYYVGYFDFMKSFLKSNNNLEAASMFVSYPFLSLWMSGVCSRLSWNSIVNDANYVDEEDRNYTILTARLLDISTGNALTQQLLTLGAIIATLLSKK